VTEEGPPELSGLAALRHRLVENGGELVVSRTDGRFLTAAAFRSKTPPSKIREDGR
jgi:two-component system sensor histidine kinase DesK